MRVSDTVHRARRRRPNTRAGGPQTGTRPRPGIGPVVPGSVDGVTVMRRQRWAEMDTAARGALMRRGLDDIFDTELRRSIGGLIDDVRERGDAAVCDALARFDGVEVEPDGLRVSTDEFERAAVTPDVDTAIDDAIAHLRAFNEAQMERARDWSIESEPGLTVGEKITPITSAGLFTPSGKASYPSVAYQLAVPAVVAGVPSVALVVPPVPGGSGEVDPAVLVVCRKLGIRDVFRVNGPAGIAALGFGTQSIPKVRKIVGPGSPAVTIAQVEMQRHGVATMMLLGPTESLVIADDSADPTLLAADLLIEAEHGTDSTVVLITTSASLADAVDEALDRQLATLPDVRATRGSRIARARTADACSSTTSTSPSASPTSSRPSTCRSWSPTVRSTRRRRPGQRRRDPRRSAHPVQCGELRHRLSGLAPDVRVRARLLGHHRRHVPQAHGDRPRRRNGAGSHDPVGHRPRRPRGLPRPRRRAPPPAALSQAVDQTPRGKQPRRSTPSEENFG